MIIYIYIYCWRTIKTSNKSISLFGYKVRTVFESLYQKKFYISSRETLKNTWDPYKHGGVESNRFESFERYTSYVWYRSSPMHIQNSSNVEKLMVPLLFCLDAGLVWIGRQETWSDFTPTIGLPTCCKDYIWFPWEWLCLKNQHWCSRI